MDAVRVWRVAVDPKYRPLLDRVAKTTLPTRRGVRMDVVDLEEDADAALADDAVVVRNLQDRGRVKPLGQLIALMNGCGAFGLSTRVSAGEMYGVRLSLTGRKPKKVDDELGPFLTNAALQPWP